MARKGREKPPVKPKTSPPAASPKISDFVARQRAFNNQEVERRAAAIRAIQAAEVQSLLSRLRLIRSYFTEEQLQMPALQFFRENLPNIEPVENEQARVLQLRWKDVEGGGGVDNASASMDFGGGGIPLSVRSVKSSFLDIANLQIPNFTLDEGLENQLAGMRKGLWTPGATSSRLSFGMTPKTLRLPKNGEMLLSVHGSPLGVYKEENLEAIHESGDGSHEGASR